MDRSERDFSLPASVAEALGGSAADGQPLNELRTANGSVVNDLLDVPDDAEFLAINDSTRNLERLSELRRLVAVWASPPSTEFFRAIARAPSLRAMYAGWFQKLDEVPLAGAASLEHLVLSYATRLVDLSFLRDLPALRTLVIDDMMRLDLTTLPQLPNLVGLALGGGIWSTMKVASLAPLTRLPNLRYLTLYSIRPADGSLRPLSELCNLREVKLPNYFSLGEFARLSGALVDTKGDVLTPFFIPDSIPGLWTCPRCTGPRYMMTGRPTAYLCPKCDAAKVDKRIARWEAARASGWPA